MTLDRAYQLGVCFGDLLAGGIDERSGVRVGNGFSSDGESEFERLEVRKTASRTAHPIGIDLQGDGFCFDLGRRSERDQ